mgnify:CR=1 FL=1
MEEKKFDELLTSIEVIVKDLESGNIDLETSIEKYSEAMKMIKICSDKLNSATESVNKILEENGNLSVRAVSCVPIAPVSRAGRHLH